MKVLFFDLSGYTAMSGKLDPEEVKEIMSRVFRQIAQVVTKYEGFIEKLVGDTQSWPCLVCSRSMRMIWCVPSELPWKFMT